MSEPKIAMVCYSDSYGKRSYYIATDIPVKIVYTRRPHGLFVGQHGDFFDFLSGTGAKGQAFAGREFDINVDDGTKFHCRGDVWSIAAPKDIAPELVYIGNCDVKRLSECYVYCSGYVRKHVLEEWLANNEPREYWAYEKELQPRRYAHSEGESRG